MILHRFCSQEEFDRYMRGELLVNEKTIVSLANQHP